MKEPIFCGAGRVEVTPSAQMAPLLQGLGPQKITGILDPLFVRVILFQAGAKKAMLVSVDLDKAPNHEEFLDILSRKTGVAQDAILYFGIHTHTAPIMGYRPFEHQNMTLWSQEERDAFNAYTEILKNALLEAAQAAMDNLAPAKIGWGHGQSFINVNRCCHYEVTDEAGRKKSIVETGFNGSGDVDRDVFVLRVERLSGEPVAFFVNYACHNVVMFLHDAGDGGIHISHDMGGSVSYHLEQRFPGTVAIWSSGAAGNINPIMATQNYFPRIEDGTSDLSPFHNFAMSVELRDRLAGKHLEDILVTNRQIQCSTICGDIGNAVRFISVPEEEQTEDPWSHSRIRMRLVTIGEIALMGINGELFGSLGKMIRDSAPGDDTVIINHDCSLMLDNPGYILDDETNEMCWNADVVRMPHDGFKAHKGYLPEQLCNCTRSMFAEIKNNG